MRNIKKYLRYTNILNDIDDERSITKRYVTSCYILFKADPLASARSFTVARRYVTSLYPL